MKILNIYWYTPPHSFLRPDVITMLKILLSCCLLMSLSLPVTASDFETDLATTGKPENFDALRELHTRALAGDAAAQLNLGGAFFKGQDIEQDYAEAAKWFHKAARQGLAQAQFNLGMMYATGRGVPLDPAQSVKWYHYAAEHGLAMAQLNLGVAYVTGEGVAQNEAEAVKWMRLAADQGEAQAQFNLGVMYANGQGVKQDLVEAYRLAKAAAAQGHETAPALLSDLNRQMNAEQRARANKPGNPVASKTSPAVANKSLAALVSQRKERAANTEPTPIVATEVAPPVASPAKEIAAKVIATKEIPGETSTANSTNYVQLSAFKNREEAERLLEQLKSRLGDLGKPYGIYSYDGWVRIHVGPYDTLDEARNVAFKVKEKLGFNPMLKQH